MKFRGSGTNVKTWDTKFIIEDDSSSDPYFVDFNYKEQTITCNCQPPIITFGTPAFSLCRHIIFVNEDVIKPGKLDVSGLEQQKQGGVYDTNIRYVFDNAINTVQTKESLSIAVKKSGEEIGKGVISGLNKALGESILAGIMGGSSAISAFAKSATEAASASLRISDIEKAVKLLDQENKKNKDDKDRWGRIAYFDKDGNKLMSIGEDESDDSMIKKRSWTTDWNLTLNEWGTKRRDKYVYVDPEAQMQAFNSLAVPKRANIFTISQGEAGGLDIRGEVRNKEIRINWRGEESYAVQLMDQPDQIQRVVWLVNQGRHVCSCQDNIDCIHVEAVIKAGFAIREMRSTKADPNDLTIKIDVSNGTMKIPTNKKQSPSEDDDHPPMSRYKAIEL